MIENKRIACETLMVERLFKFQDLWIVAVLVAIVRPMCCTARSHFSYFSGSTLLSRLQYFGCDIGAPRVNQDCVYSISFSGKIATRRAHPPPLTPHTEIPSHSRPLRAQAMSFPEKITGLP